MVSLISGDAEMFKLTVEIKKMKAGQSGSAVSAHKPIQPSSVPARVVRLSAPSDDQSATVRPPRARQKVESMRSRANPLRAPSSKTVFTVEQACLGLPVTVEGIRLSPIFSQDDYEDIASGEYDIDSMRMYIASWLIAGRNFPFLLHHDWQDRL